MKRGKAQNTLEERWGHSEFISESARMLNQVQQDKTKLFSINKMPFV